MMDRDQIATRVFEALRPNDLEVLLNLNFRRPYERGDVVIAAGELVDRFYLLEEGTLEVEADGGTETRYLRPGHVLGSTTVLQHRNSASNVTARDDVIVISLTNRELDWLVEAEPAVAARLMRCLVTALAARNVDAPVGAGAVPEAPPRRQEPSALTRLSEACLEARKALEALGPAPEDGSAYWARERIPAVATHYRPVLRALAGLLQGVTGAERQELTELARGEVLQIAGTSRLVERMRTRPTGDVAGYRGLNQIYRNVPEGDDTLGLLTDAWLLTRPFAEAIRERRAVATERLIREVLDRARPDRMVRILSLGCGPARSLADLLEEPGMADKISVTCVDDDQEALVHANNLLKSRAPRGDITFRQGRPGDLTPDTEGFGGYDIIASLYTADTADQAALGRVFFTGHRWLHAHGVLKLVVFGDAVPDWLVLEVLLYWQPRPHSPRELQDILSRSPFKQSNTEVGPTPSGLNVFLRAVK
jgi:extracellular factor (EF) 3-hydroxypalmitic acid methyl ester biosynthesis protein